MGHDKDYERQKKLNYDYTEIENTAPIEERILVPSTLETIDQALNDYIRGLNIFATTNKGFKAVPVVWTSASRAHHIKNNPELRDTFGRIILPAIAIERGNVTKDPARRAAIYGNVLPNEDGGTITIARRIKQDKTSNFASADAKRLFKQKNFPSKNKKIVYETITAPIPVYVDVDYEISLRTEYMQQMNQIMSPFLTTGGAINYFSLRADGHHFEGFIDPDYAFETNSSDLGADEKMYETSVSIKVLGYLMGADKNQESPKFVKTENAVEIRLQRERVIVGDIPEHIGKKGFYRE